MDSAKAKAKKAARKVAKDAAPKKKITGGKAKARPQTKSRSAKRARKTSRR